jgi:hypothetical protein
LKWLEHSNRQDNMVTWWFDLNHSLFSCRTYIYLKLTCKVVKHWDWENSSRFWEYARADRFLLSKVVSPLTKSCLWGSNIGLCSRCS